MTSLVEKLPAMSKFCANLAFLFQEKPFLERYMAAKDAGFKTVETGFPFGFTKEEVVKAKKKAGIDQILINILTGDITKGELGYAALPGKENEFKKSIETTIDYAKALGASKIHIMSGRVEGDITEAHDRTFLENIKYATKLLQQQNITGLLEPINKFSVPDYYMNSYEKALNVIKEVNSPNLKILLDVFHLQLIKGDITHTIQELKPYIGHMQIAQAPHRNEPNTSGEINFQYVFDLLKKEGYDDWIGLEYKPQSGGTLEGLKWVKEMGYNL